jgi:hypothetical protein
MSCWQECTLYSDHTLWYSVCFCSHSFQLCPTISSHFWQSMHKLYTHPWTHTRTHTHTHVQYSELVVNTHLTSTKEKWVCMGLCMWVWVCVQVREKEYVFVMKEGADFSWSHLHNVTCVRERKDSRMSSFECAWPTNQTRAAFWLDEKISFSLWPTDIHVRV